MPNILSINDHVHFFRQYQSELDNNKLILKIIFIIIYYIFREIKKLKLILL